MRDNNK